MHGNGGDSAIRSDERFGGRGGVALSHTPRLILFPSSCWWLTQSQDTGGNKHNSKLVWLAFMDFTLTPCLSSPFFFPFWSWSKEKSGKCFGWSFESRGIDQSAIRTCAPPELDVKQGREKKESKNCAALGKPVALVVSTWQQTLCNRSWSIRP